MVLWIGGRFSYGFSQLYKLLSREYPGWELWPTCFFSVIRGLNADGPTQVLIVPTIDCFQVLNFEGEGA